MKIKIGRKRLEATIFEVPSAEALEALLPLKGKGTRIGDELWVDLPPGIPKDEDVLGVIHKGDILLFGDDTLILALEEREDHRRYTLLGRVSDPGMLDSLQGQEFNITLENERKIPSLLSISLQGGGGSELSLLPQEGIAGKGPLDKAIRSLLSEGSALVVGWDEAREWLMEERLLGGSLGKRDLGGARLLLLDWNRKLAKEEWEGLRECFGEALVPVYPLGKGAKEGALPWRDGDPLLFLEEAKRRLGITKALLHEGTPICAYLAEEGFLSEGILIKTGSLILPLGKKRRGRSSSWPGEVRYVDARVTEEGVLVASFSLREKDGQAE